MNDLLIEELISQEKERQLSGLELIASENYVSNDVYTALGSVLTNKYAEGYPNHRYYGGCEIIDQVEQLAIDRANKLFNTTYANVQPHSGSQANRAVIEAVCNHGDTAFERFQLPHPFQTFRGSSRTDIPFLQRNLPHTGKARQRAADDEEQQAAD